MAKVEIKRYKFAETVDGFGVMEVVGETETLAQEFKVVKPTIPKGATATETAKLWADALETAKNMAMSYLRSNLFRQYNEMVGFERFTPQLVSETEFAVFEEVATEEVQAEIILA